MAKLISLAAAVLITSVSLAQNLLECIDPEVREGLLGERPIDGDTVVTRSVPPVFADFEAPDNFDLIAGAVSNTMSSVAYRTALDPQAAAEAALTAAEQAGWSVQSSTRAFGGPFVLGNTPVTASACTGDDRAVIVRARAAGAEESYLTLSQLPAAANVACTAQPGQQIPERMQLQVRLTEFMPTLRLPEGAKDSRSGSIMAMSSSGSGSENGVSRSVTIEVAMSAGQLADYLSAQILEQGWQPDASWSGRVSAGSSWVATPEPDLDLVGTLGIVEVAESSYEISLEVLRRS